MVAAAVALCVSASPGEAHLVTTGLGPVYDGLGHFVLSLDDVLAVVALGIFAGLRGPAAGRAVLWILPCAWLLAGEVAQWNAGARDFSFPAISLLALGILAATDARVPRWGIALLAMTVGALHGFSNGLAMAAGSPGWRGVLGISAAVFLVVTLVAGGVASLRAVWARTAARVAGSWIAAVGLLLLGWVLRPGR